MGKLSGRGYRNGMLRAGLVLLPMLLLMLLPVMAQAGLQRWTDAEGVIYYRQVESSPSPEQARTPATEQAASSAKTRSANKQLAKKPAKPRSAPKTADSARTAARKRQQAQARTEARQQKQCARLQAKLQRIQQRLDEGYREPEGNRLRRQRRELRSALFRDCR